MALAPAAAYGAVTRQRTDEQAADVDEPPAQRRRNNAPRHGQASVARAAPRNRPTVRRVPVVPAVPGADRNNLADVPAPLAADGGQRRCANRAGAPVLGPP